MFCNGRALRAEDAGVKLDSFLIENPQVFDLSSNLIQRLKLVPLSKMGTNCQNCCRFRMISKSGWGVHVIEVVGGTNCVMSCTSIRLNLGKNRQPVVRQKEIEDQNCRLLNWLKENDCTDLPAHLTMPMNVGVTIDGSSAIFEVLDQAGYRVIYRPGIFQDYHERRVVVWGQIFTRISEK